MSLARKTGSGQNARSIAVNLTRMQVSMQEFKSHLAQYIQKAQSGQDIELTSHRKVVARVIGVPQTGSAGLNRLLAQGKASWQGGKPKGANIALQAHGKPVSMMVLEDRE